MPAGALRWSALRFPGSHSLPAPENLVPVTLNMRLAPFRLNHGFASTNSGQQLPTENRLKQPSPASTDTDATSDTPTPEDPPYPGSSQPMFGLPLFPYHDPAELTEHAKVLNDINLDLPELNGMSDAGKVVLTLFINETGSVDSVEIETTDFDSALSQALARQFSGGIFQPAQISSATVKSRMRIEVLISPILQPSLSPATPTPSAAGN